MLRANGLYQSIRSWKQLWCSCSLYLKASPLALTRRKEVGNTQREAKLKHHIKRFCSDESGATAIEYGLIAAGIALAIIAVVNGLGTNLNTQFTSINSSLK